MRYDTYEMLGRSREFNEITNYLESFDWEWFVTLTVPDDMEDDDLMTRFKRWKQSVYEVSRLQIASFGFYIDGKTKHLHLLMLSRRGKRGRSLKGMPKSHLQYLEQRWFALTGRTADIEIIINKAAVANYITGNKNIRTSPWCFIDPVNVRLLKRKIHAVQRPRVSVSSTK